MDLRPRLLVPLATALLAVGCDGASPERTPDADSAHVDSGATAPDASVDGVVPDSTTFEQRVGILLFASQATFDSLRAAHDEETFMSIGDHMSWYRAEAWAWIEEHGIPLVQLEGRPPLRFRVGNELRTYDFADSTSLDLVVLYDPPRAPIALAPIDVSLRAAAYFEADD